VPSQSGTFNSGKGIKIIRQPSYSLNIASADFISLLETEVRAGNLSLSQGSLKKSLEGLSQPIAETSPPLSPYSCGWTAAKSTSE
jgi:hypothetical protein